MSFDFGQHYVEIQNLLEEAVAWLFSAELAYFRLAGFIPHR